MINLNYITQCAKALCLAFLLGILPGCCWGGCLEKCKPCQPCNPCNSCDDSCVIKEPRKSNRSYQKNTLEEDEDLGDEDQSHDEDEEIVELENEL